MTAADFSDKWSRLPPPERRLTGIRAVELADPAAEATGHRLGAARSRWRRRAQTAALVTPDRMLAARVSALLARWGIEADDSAGRALSQWPAGTLLLAIAAAAAEEFAPVPCWRSLKHPLVGGEGDERLAGWTQVRALDLALRGPRPAAGTRRARPSFRETRRADGGLGCGPRPSCQAMAMRFAPPIAARPASPSACARRRRPVRRCAPGAGPTGAWRRELVAELEAAGDARGLTLDADEWVPVLRQMLDARPVRPPYGGHPRIFIWGLLEARLQKADLLVLGGLNEGVWPALAAPDPWLAPQDPRRPRPARPRLSDRPRRARFRQRAGRAARADHPGPARQPVADRRLALLAAAARR